MNSAQSIESTARVVGAGVTKPDVARSVAAGVIAGQIAGLAMAAFMMAVFTVFLGKTPFYPVQVIGSLVFGDAALNGFNLPALFAGLILHQLGPSVFWGCAFGLVSNALGSPRGSLLVGLALGTGVLSQIVDVNIVLPFAFRVLHGHDIWAEQVPAFWSWASHVVFGLGLTTFPIVSDLLLTPPTSGR